MTNYKVLQALITFVDSVADKTHETFAFFRVTAHSSTWERQRMQIVELAGSK